MALSRIVTQLLCMFSSDSGACLFSGEMELKLCLIFHELGFVAHDLRQTQHTYYMYISFPELVQFINCETVCFLCDLSVTNNDFEHACYALPHYTLP